MGLIRAKVLDHITLLLVVHAVHKEMMVMMIIGSE